MSQYVQATITIVSLLNPLICAAILLRQGQASKIVSFSFHPLSAGKSVRIKL
jgi:hypothetical protein